MKCDLSARSLKIEGIVQGVGFRPFIFQLADRYGLKGEVANTSLGVSIHIEGEKKNIESFCEEIIAKPPPLAHITTISDRSETVKGFSRFFIAESRRENKQSPLISPDISVCPDCLRELFDPDDRRFRYPFINCTNCGPRYTIIDDIPYDRPKTSMKHFAMCKRCQAEYDDPKDRRFHAQPNACNQCGPQVSLFDNKGKNISASSPIEETAKLLTAGYILAIKGLGGFHLAVDAQNNAAVAKLRKRKHREEKPLAMMSYDIDRVNRYAHIEPEERDLLLSPQRPIVILKKKDHSMIAEAVAPKSRYFGVMLPYTPLHYLILECGFTAIVMTSGNLSEEPIAIDNEEAFTRLSKIADYFLVHNRDIYLRSDDSIIKKMAGVKRLIRRSRGYVPAPVFLNTRLPQVLACGAELKNTICLTKENHAFLSQHIGDLENRATYDFFTMTIRHMKQILNIDPQIVAYDLHPDYLSTLYALEQNGIQKIPVQHHHAHIVSCMAENRIDDPVIGLAFDGTGYGSDGNIWGGEVLIADAARFTRMAHLSYIPMPGSNAAIKEPWRMAISYLYDVFGEALWSLELPLIQDMDEMKIRVMTEMIKKNINSPLTSSLGRLFDGIAGIMGIRNHVKFEGQAAMELEMLAHDNSARMKHNAIYDYEWEPEDLYKINFKPIIKGVVKDMKNRTELSEISGKFHMTLIRLFSQLCDEIGKKNGLNRVALSGGVFQNSILLTGLSQTLKEMGFEVFTHSRVPSNDGGICLGQAVVAAANAND